MIGELAIVGRTSQFEVVYDVPERVLPDAVLDAPDLTVEEQHLALVRRAARSHGVATVGAWPTTTGCGSDRPPPRWR